MENEITDIAPVGVPCWEKTAKGTCDIQKQYDNLLDKEGL